MPDSKLIGYSFLETDRWTALVGSFEVLKISYKIRQKVAGPEKFELFGAREPNIYSNEIAFGITIGDIPVISFLFFAMAGNRIWHLRLPNLTLYPLSYRIISLILSIHHRYLPHKGTNYCPNNH